MTLKGLEGTIGKIDDEKSWPRSPSKREKVDQIVMNDDVHQFAFTNICVDAF